MFCKLSANQFGGLDREWQVLYRVAQGHYEMAKKLYLKLGLRNGVLYHEPRRYGICDPSNRNQRLETRAKHHPGLRRSKRAQQPAWPKATAATRNAKSHRWRNTAIPAEYRSAPAL